jgi:hypothetical protein
VPSRVGGGGSPNQAASTLEVRRVSARSLWYCGDAMRREESYFCVTCLLHCKNGTPFALPVGDGCNAYSIPPIAYLTLFCIRNVLLKLV